MTGKQIIRELAASEKQLAANKRMQDTNDLKLVRPPVLLNEIPWYQMDIDGDLTCMCQDPLRLRGMEPILFDLYDRPDHLVSGGRRCAGSILRRIRIRGTAKAVPLEFID